MHKQAQIMVRWRNSLSARLLRHLSAGARLREELSIRHGSGAFGKWLIQLARIDVLLVDNWGMGAIDSMTRSDLLEIIDDHAANKARIITSQLPMERYRGTDHDCTSSHGSMRPVMLSVMV